MSDEKIALIDLDGTVADYDTAMAAWMQKIQGPDEEPYISRFDVKGKFEPDHMRARRLLIQNYPGFWRNLNELELGMHIVEDLRAIGFGLHVLTKGPRESVAAWTEKVQWCQQHLPDATVTISGDKSLVYGRVLVDDWPMYFMKWLDVRPRGLVVCVKQSWNETVSHPNIIHYDGSNRDELRERLKTAYNRESGK
jgi:5'-nucleotidase